MQATRSVTRPGSAECVPVLGVPASTFRARLFRGFSPTVFISGVHHSSFSWVFLVVTCVDLVLDLFCAFALVVGPVKEFVMVNLDRSQRSRYTGPRIAGKYARHSASGACRPGRIRANA
jgi:hypothetical protein